MVTIKHLDNLHIHYDISSDVLLKLESLNSHYLKILKFMERIDIALGKINEQTNKIAVTTDELATSQQDVADDIRKIVEQMAGGLTKEQAEAHAAKLEESASTLEAGANKLQTVSEALKGTAAEYPVVTEPGNGDNGNTETRDEATAKKK